MKMKQVSIACTLALAGLSGQAFALNPTQSAAAQVKLFISGSSAQQASLGALAASVCAAGTIDVYGDAASPYKNYRAYSCTAKTTAVDPSIPASISGKTLLITERAAGGSIYGVIPVARTTEKIANMVVSGAAGACSTAPVGTIDTAGRVNPGTPIGSTYPLWSCSTTSPSNTPDLGVSDVEPDMFGAQINIDQASTPTWYTNPYNATDAANLDILPELAAVFGIPVSNTIGGVANAITNLTKSQVASIMSGTYTDWHQVKSSIPAGTTINICRRVAGSGTQAGTNAWFMANPCLGPYSGSLSPLTASANVFENASSGLVASCMNTKGNAIGLLGVETQPGAGDTWHFATIDGQSPSTANAAQGTYDFYVESTFQYRKSTPAGAVRDLMDLIRAKAGDPSVIASLGIPGVLALPTNGWMPDSPYVATNPVSWGSRSGHTCSATQLLFP